MIPLRDENPVVRTPVMTVALIVANVIIWVMVQGLGSEPGLARSLCQLALIPGDFLGLADPGTAIQVTRHYQCRLDGGLSMLTPISSMFLHGGWFHLIGNMWFLWVFGDNVEDAMGPLRFAAFYLLGGLAAAAAQVATDPASLLPMVGASGAIGAVMGGYIRLYPHARILTLVILVFYVFTVSMPAMAWLGIWFGLQLMGGIPALSGTGGGVAFWAHIGGFLAGLLLVKLFYRPDYYRQHRARAPARGERRF